MPATTSTTQAKVLTPVTGAPGQIKIPSVTGTPYYRADATLLALGFRVVDDLSAVAPACVDVGIATGTTPPAGTYASRGATIVVHAPKAPPFCG